MKLLRTRHEGELLTCAMAQDGTLRDISAMLEVRDDRTWMAPELLRPAGERFEERWQSLAVVPYVPEQLDIPYQPRQLITVGGNFRCHAEQVGIPLPPEPILAMKSMGAAAPPYGVLKLPKGSARVDWEVELALVIGKAIRQGSTEISFDEHVAGYCVANDISDRDWLLQRGGQWVKGKSSDGFGRLGPMLVTPQSALPLHEMTLTCSVNGQLMQSARASEMIFTPHALITYIATFMSLAPGDTIFCGSPAGVALGRPGQSYLQSGDVLESGITGLGMQKLVCEAMEG
ncbi:fumarylacetoacetate hydrolase family protein [Mitsuaria sp. WAJ17]|uniref:fumarylacetoacetate hydrolase family protein n=1 Tax=Mitsuaria sp. WAJ17 TaxID=2761452 RepID=UPI001601D871|nr:fumarylacetoacetate hydrolase family protein [Mitsuaria sp. WAJ17]MBB2485693.1 fumarylacetoacetate hydrolase family protein [Mitsuaria sp. WAJ17]